MAPTRPRPAVVLHAEMSIDARLALSPGVLLMTDRRWPGSEGYVGVMERHRPSVLLEGAGSFVTDGARPEPLPEPDLPAAELLADYLPGEAVALATRGWLAVTDSRGRVRWQFKTFPDPQWEGWHVLVLVSRCSDPAYLAYLRRERIPYLVRGEERVDLAAAIEAFGDLGVRTLAVTGGGRLGGALLRAGLIDEIELEVLPMAVGGRAVTTLFEADDLGPDDQPTALRLIEAAPGEDGRVLLRYRVG